MLRLGAAIALLGVYGTIITSSSSRIGIRSAVTEDIGNLVSNGCSHTSLTVPGVRTGGECAAGLPPGMPDQVISTCHIEASDHVDLHICNFGVPFDPPPATYSVRVFNP